MSNTEIVKFMYKSFAEGKIGDVLSCYHNDVIWERPGYPEIPFSGTFTGHEGMKKMLGIISETVTMRAFTPELFISDENSVAVFGKDEATVKSTGKKYDTNWVHFFTFQEKKIIHVRAYFDTLTVAKAMHA